MRKPFGVWMLVSGQPWMYCQEPTLGDALLTARTLRGTIPLFPRAAVWIAAPVRIGVQSDRAPRLARRDRPCR